MKLLKGLTFTLTLSFLVLPSWGSEALFLECKSSQLSSDFRYYLLLDIRVGIAEAHTTENDEPRKGTLDISDSTYSIRFDDGFVPNKHTLNRYTGKMISHFGDSLPLKYMCKQKDRKF